jgi:hypothetical protein
MSTELTIWLTPEGEAANRAAYDATLSLWPAPVEDVYVPTRYGLIHLIVRGAKGAPPLLLLHAVNNSATEWYGNVSDLSRDRRVYAIDGWPPGLPLSFAAVDPDSELIYDHIAATATAAHMHLLKPQVQCMHHP